MLRISNLGGKIWAKLGSGSKKRQVEEEGRLLPRSGWARAGRKEGRNILTGS